MGNHLYGLRSEMEARTARGPGAPDVPDTWLTLVQRTVATALGPLARLAIEPAARGFVVTTWLPTGDGQVQAIAGGRTAEDACRMLVRLLARQDASLSTQEVAEALGLDDSTIRWAAKRGQIAPESSGTGVRAGRYSPAEIYHYHYHARGRG